MLRVALTGNIAAGKSTVARSWRELGGVVVEADALARRAVAPGTPALSKISDRWGPGIVLPSGELDRAALRDVVFRDPDERRILEAIVHPEVNRLRKRAFAEAAARGAEIVVGDIPLLFEVGLEDEFAAVVLVDAPEAVRLERLLQDRGLEEDEAQRMIDSQLPTTRKRAAADFVIDNVDSIADLEARAKEVWSELLLRARGHSGGLP
ncbi:MAG: dephospho-CoA kinase [Gemmatimonadota bacterium]